MYNFLLLESMVYKGSEYNLVCLIGDCWFCFYWGDKVVCSLG